MSLLARRRAMMATPKKTGPIVPAIPNEYQRVEYISVDDDNGYVDTGITVSIGYIIWIDAKFTRKANAAGIIGFITSELPSGAKTWTVQWFVYNPTDIECRVYTNWNSDRRASMQCAITDRHLFTLDSKNNLFTIDGTSVALDFSGSVPTRTLKLGKAHDTNSSAHPIIWLAGYKKPDETEHFIIPCYRKQDDVNGVFCTETQTFHEFTGTTSRGGNV